ncbi:MAG TPA: adenosyl-hopene transferase HpnH [Thermodesulfobacteriota bacterium]|nr:adenosyl-hopene transferase HpnH [Thermodesulfobacteriota bacterium]
MRYPWQLSASLAGYLLKQRLAGRRRYPIVLMLEPTELCNVACEGCGRIREYESTIKERLTVEECLQAVDECGAPIVSICGGEPLLYRDIVPLVEGIVARRRHVYLCTNAILLKRTLPKLKPSPYLSFSIHLDGLEATHDRILNRKGTWRIAIEAIKAAKAAGFRVCTNTTIFKDTDPDEVIALLRYLKDLGVDGNLLSPAFEYTVLKGAGIFDTKEAIREKFRRIAPHVGEFPLENTPLYLEFLEGKREYVCTPWGNVTFNPSGWKGPCYLITDAHYSSFAELMANTDWDRYEHRRDERCQNCLVHCSVEPTVIRQMRLADLPALLRWQLSA